MLTYLYYHHTHSYCIYIGNCYIAYDRILFGYSVNLLFILLQPAIYWLYASPYIYLHIMENILFIQGYQWFFGFKYNNMHINMFGDTMLNNDNIFIILNIGRYRIATSSNNSLHSIGICSIGIKLDCVPGKYLSIPIILNKGYIIGRCYELCGQLHHIMYFNILIDIMVP